MAKLKLKKYPKKPKASASVEAIKNYFAKCKDIDRENAHAKKQHAEHEKLVKQLKNYKPGHSRATGVTKRRKKSAPKKAAKKTVRRKSRR